MGVIRAGTEGGEGPRDEEAEESRRGEASEEARGEGPFGEEGEREDVNESQAEGARKRLRTEGRQEVAQGIRGVGTEPLGAMGLEGEYPDRQPQGPEDWEVEQEREAMYEMGGSSTAFDAPPEEQEMREEDLASQVRHDSRADEKEEDKGPYGQ